MTTPENWSIPDLHDEYGREAAARVEEKVAACKRDLQWQEAREFLNRLRGNAVTSLFTADQLHRIETLRRELDRTEDEHLYEKIRQYPDDDHIARYLKDAPVKAMRREVEAFRKHRQLIKGPLPLTLKLSRIEWGNVWDGTTNFGVRTEDRTILEGSVTAKKNSASADIGECQITGKLADTIILSVGMTHVGSIKNTDYGWQNVYEGSIGALVKGKEVTYANAHDSRLMIVVDGQPPEPPLPDYRSAP